MPIIPEWLFELASPQPRNQCNKNSSKTIQYGSSCGRQWHKDITWTEIKSTKCWLRIFFNLWKSGLEARNFLWTTEKISITIALFYFRTEIHCSNIRNLFKNLNFLGNIIVPENWSPTSTKFSVNVTRNLFGCADRLSDHIEI